MNKIKSVLNCRLWGDPAGAWTARQDQQALMKFHKMFWFFVLPMIAVIAILVFSSATKEVAAIVVMSILPFTMVGSLAFVCGLKK